MAWYDFLTGTDVSDFLSGGANNAKNTQNDLWKDNAKFTSDEARKQYEQAQGQGAPKLGYADYDPTRRAGEDASLAWASGGATELANKGKDTLLGVQGGTQAGTDALKRAASGELGPQFNQAGAEAYNKFVQGGLTSANQGLANQANMAWNQAGPTSGGGILSSGRNALNAQAQQNIGTNLGTQQANLAYQAATNAANLGGQYGSQQYAGQLNSAQNLVNNGLNASGQTEAMQRAGFAPGREGERIGSNRQDYAQGKLNTDYANDVTSRNYGLDTLNKYKEALGSVGTGANAPDVNRPNNLLAGLDLAGISLPGLVQGGIGAIGNLFGGGGSGGKGAGKPAGGSGGNIPGQPAYGGGDYWNGGSGGDWDYGGGSWEGDDWNWDTGNDWDTSGGDWDYGGGSWEGDNWDWSW